MPTLAELGITDRQSSDWQAIIGRLTDAELEEHIVGVSRRSGGEVTTNEAVRRTFCGPPLRIRSGARSAESLTVTMHPAARAWELH